MKDDVNQADMQAFNKLSSGYKQAADDDLAKLLMGNDLWVDDEDVISAQESRTQQLQQQE